MVGGFHESILNRWLDHWRGEKVIFENGEFWVVVSIIFYFQPYLGKIPILTNIFQMGWNHQLVNFISSLSPFYDSLPRISAGRYLTSGPATATSDPRQNQNLSFVHVRPINNGREDNSLRSFWSGALNDFRARH